MLSAMMCRDSVYTRTNTLDCNLSMICPSFVVSLPAVALWLADRSNAIIERPSFDHDTEVTAKSLATGPCTGRCSPLTRGVLREDERNP
jgi:hypothetical protein